MNTLRVATYNLRHGLGYDGRLDLARSAATIVATRASFVGLQELDRGHTRSGRVDQPEALRDLTGMRVLFFPTMQRRGGWQYGIGVAASGDLDARFVSLPRAGDEEPRGAIAARWNGLSIVVAHVSYERPARRLQTDALADLASRLEPPVVVMGDLNQSRRGLGALAAAGFDPGPRRRTLRSLLPRQVDFVMPGPGVELRALWTIPSAASDHVALVAEIAPAAGP